jgi:hypothetical protein
LIEDDPPTTLPRAHSIGREPSSGSGSEKYIQSFMRCRNNRGQPSGMWIQGLRSQPPASSSSTLTEGSSVSRSASTQPADPAPTMTKS